MKLIFLIAVLLVATTSIAQKDGAFLSDRDPVNNLWEFDGDKDFAAPIAGMPQQFFFLVGDGSKKSMMAPFEMEGMGFACPTYFTVSSEDKFLYLDIHEACDLDLEENELYVKIGYSLDMKNTILVLKIEEKEYRYKHWN